MILGILSGAMGGTARTKPEPASLGSYAIFSAYGSDSPDRTQVTWPAVPEAARLHGSD